MHWDSGQFLTVRDWLKAWSETGWRWSMVNQLFSTRCPLEYRDHLETGLGQSEYCLVTAHVMFTYRMP